MVKVQCVGCAAVADTDDGACRLCGTEIPVIFGNVDLDKLGSASTAALPPVFMQTHHTPPDFPLASAAPRPAPARHKTGPALELVDAPQRGARGRAAVAGALRRATSEPVVKSSIWSRAAILVLLLLAAYVLYSLRK